MIELHRALTPEARLSLLIDARSGVVVERKPYIQPFERTLAAAELAGLRGEAPNFGVQAQVHALLDSDTDARRLRDRLAYWQRVGAEQAGATLQVRLEASARADPDQLPTKRLLRYGPHDLHEYRGKFFPQLVRALINAAGLARGSVVVDPMSGSGTTVAEARALGMRGLGLDLNPLSVRIATAKAGVLDLDPARFSDATRRLLRRLCGRPRGEPRWADADQAYLDRWFDPRALRDVASITGAIDTERDGPTKAIFEVSLSNVLRAISWQRVEDLRVRKAVGTYAPGEAIETFVAEIEQQVQRLVPYLRLMRERGPFPAAQIREGDARRADETLRGHVGRCDLLITSPPYAMALPYIDTDRLSLCALGLLPRVGHRTRESRMVGNREVSERQRAALWNGYLERRDLLPARARRLIEALAEVNHGDEVGFRRRNLPGLLAKYFLDMRDVMASARRLVRPGAYGFWVVGNNSTQVRGDRVEVPTDELLWELGEGVGWRQYAQLDMQLLPSRDIFRKNRGSAERILGFRADVERRAVYVHAPVSDAADWDFHGVETQEHLHALHPYPARFIPQIPRRAIGQWSREGERVLDPFAGGGTTLLEAMLCGRPSVGVDNNAVAHLVARAKTQRYQARDLARLRRFVRAVEAGELEGLEPVVPDYPNREHWFCDAALDDLGRLRAGIARLPPRPRLFALAVLSSVVLRASRQDSDTRYARVEREYPAGRATRWFGKRLANGVERLASVLPRPRADCDCHLADGRELKFIEDASIDLLITSPPYLNAYDYHKYHRHRLHWIGGDVDMARDLEIGKHDTFTRKGARPEPYFDDMAACFGEWARVLRPGARAVIVVGDAIVSGTPVAVADRLATLLEARGLPLEERFVRRLDTARKSFNQRARIDREHVLVARRA